MELNENERIDDLGLANLKIIQNEKNFCFGIDAVLLSDFAKGIKKGAKVVDLGTGSGIIATLLCGKTELEEIIGVEIQKDVSDMAKRSIELNNLQNRFKILNEDLKKIDTIISKQSIDVIVTNPPYKKCNTGIINDDKNKLISRHEVECNLDDIARVANSILKDKGEFYMVHRPERLPEIITVLKKYKLEPKILRLIQGRQNLKPNLLLIKAVKNANEFLEVQNTLVVYNDDGSYTDEILKIYGKEVK